METGSKFGNGPMKLKKAPSDLKSSKILMLENTVVPVTPEKIETIFQQLVRITNLNFIRP